MMPDYLSYKLTGVMKNEYTNATTTGLVNAESKQWDTELLRSLGIPEKLFLPLSMPGTPVGMFSEDVQREVGFHAEVLLLHHFVHCVSLLFFVGYDPAQVH